MRLVRFYREGEVTRLEVAGEMLAAYQPNDTPGVWAVQCKKAMRLQDQGLLQATEAGTEFWYVGRERDLRGHLRRALEELVRKSLRDAIDAGGQLRIGDPV